jgi:hypothetical protein
MFSEYGLWDCIHNTSFSLQLMKELYKIICYTKLGSKGLKVTEARAYWADAYVMDKMKFFEYSFWNCIHNTSFSLQLTERTYKIICYTKLGSKGLKVTDTRAYWADT